MGRLNIKVNRAYEEADAIDVTPEMNALRTENERLKFQNQGVGVAMGTGTVIIVILVIALLAAMSGLK